MRRITGRRGCPDARTGIRVIKNWFFVSVAAALLAACSAGVDPAPSTPAPGTIVITPNTATAFAELPTSFVLSGGTAPYFVTSSNQAVVPVVGTVSGTSFTIIPAQVAADTPVTLTVRDSANSPEATASLSVRPRTVSNIVTVTPSAGQSPACGTSVCAGGDAEISTQLTLAGLPLVGRSVRFDVVSGEFRIIPDSSVNETEATAATTTTDATGTARIRIRVRNNATAQTGLLQITDLTSGFSQRVSVPIAPLVSLPLGAQPERIEFVGRTQNSCASNTDTPSVSADVIISGGRPPYQVTRPPNFLIDNDRLSASGGGFRVTPLGVCVTSQTIAIADSLGATTIVTLSNQPGLATSNVVATPPTLTIDNCAQQAYVRVAGGTPPYYASVGADTLEVLPSPVSMNGDFQIRRRPNTSATTNNVQVGFTDGRTTATVQVTIAGVALTSICFP